MTKTIKGSIIIDIDEEKIDENELEKWLEEQLEEMRQTNHGILGFSVNIEK